MSWYGNTCYVTCSFYGNPSVTDGFHTWGFFSSLQWRHNGCDGSQITDVSIVHSTICLGADQRKYRSSATLAFVRRPGEFPAQRSSNAGNVSVWWRHHALAWTSSWTITFETPWRTCATVLMVTNKWRSLRWWQTECHRTIPNKSQFLISSPNVTIYGNCSS